MLYISINGIAKPNSKYSQLSSIGIMASPNKPNQKHMTNREVKTIKYFNQAELTKLFKTIEQTKAHSNKYWLRDLTMFNIIYIWGLRSSEVSLLKLRHYNSNTGELFVTRKKWSVSNAVRLWNKQKLLEKYIKTHLFNLHDTDQPLFITRNKKPPHRKTIEYLMKKYCKLAKLNDDKAHPHSLKHSIAIHIAESWADIKDLQAYLWHKRIDSTLEYYRYTTTQQNDFYKKIGKNSKIV